MEYGVLFTILALCAVPAVYAFLRWLRKNDDYWKNRGLPYYPRQNLFTALKSFPNTTIHLFLLDLQKKYGRVFGSFEFRKPYLTVSDPDLLRDILVKDFHIFHYRRDMVLGENLIDKAVSVLKGEDWKRVRTIITPAFTSKRMRQMTQIINDCADTVLTTLGKFYERQEPVDVKSLFGTFTMDVIARAAFATKIDSHNDPDNIFVRQVRKSFEQPSLKRILIFLLLPLWLTRKLGMWNMEPMYFFKNVVVQVVKERRATGKRYNDVLQLLMDAQEEAESEKRKLGAKFDGEEDETDQFGSVSSAELEPKLKYKRLSEDELVAQCVLFFFVGYETTAATLTFMAYELALNPECQDKLIQEVDETYEKHKTFDYDVIRTMKYLDCVVSETLRKNPSLPRSERTASEDNKLGNTGIVVEKGTTVAFNIYCMHHDPEFFPNPENFQPERFFPENVTHPQYAYLPFGAGPRNCLGMRFALMEMKICICNIMTKYRFKKADTTKVPLDFRKGFGLVSVEKLPLMVEKRTDAINIS